MATHWLPFTIYLLRCADDGLYVGWTQNLAARLLRHNEGRGARFTSTRHPVTLLYSEEQPTLEAAQARERQIKGWSRQKKLALARGDLVTVHELSRRRRKSPGA